MTELRALRRAAVAAMVFVPLLAVAGARPASAAVGPQCGVDLACPAICFPVEGPSVYGSPTASSLATTYWTDSFGAPRDGHTHAGEDIMSVRGVKMRHLLAAANGTITETYYNNASGNRIVVKGDDGWFYVYIHVNNDTPGTDDAGATRAQVFAPGINVGTRVSAGQWIGYLGDSGNAETVGAHNHFEVHRPGSNAYDAATAVNSTSILQDAMAHPERCGASRLVPFSGAAELVSRQYADFVGSQPSTTARNTLLDQIHTDQVSEAGFTAGLLYADAYGGYVSPISRLYKAYFLRTPDTSGLAYWVQQAHGGRSMAWISDSFAQSPEFIGRYGNLANHDFVEQVYVNVLGRGSDAAGSEYWTGRLDRGELNRGEVMLGFSESPENIATTANWVQVVVAYYGLLTRTPDDGGLQYWMGVGNRTATVDGLLRSGEYASRVAALRTG